ncbi:hypothetical protein [Salinactinospora qingdaonensis]|uniref:DUF8175 domain-containing protein n=1 Tax=Salinactinospora qingdaonensis TaxID=702744 RepID=A0ABP7GQ25_9ACTN
MSIHEASKSNGATDGLLSPRGFVVVATLVVATVLLGMSATAGALIATADDSQGDMAAAAQASQEASPGDEQSAPQASETPLASAPPGFPDGSASTCGLAASEESEQTTFDAWPEATDWNGFAGNVRVPTVIGQGPGVVEGNGFRYCFAQSPTGAVLAAANYTAMLDTPELVQETVERTYAEGEGKQTVLTRLAAEGVVLDQATQGRIAGVTLVGYDDYRARVDVALTPPGETGDMTSDMVDLRWEEGDWRVVVGDDGEPVVPASTLDSLDGYLLTPQAKDQG